MIDELIKASESLVAELGVALVFGGFIIGLVLWEVWLKHE